MRPLTFALCGGLLCGLLVCRRWRPTAFWKYEPVNWVTAGVPNRGGRVRLEVNWLGSGVRSSAPKAGRGRAPGRRSVKDIGTSAATRNGRSTS